MNSDHVVGGASVTALHSSITTIIHWAWGIEPELAQAFSIIGLTCLGTFTGIAQWLWGLQPKIADNTNNNEAK